MQGLDSPLEIAPEDGILLSDSISLKHGKYLQITYYLLPMDSFEHKSKRIYGSCINIGDRKKQSIYTTRNPNDFHIESDSIEE
jgi:hypothetical protein